MQKSDFAAPPPPTPKNGHDQSPAQQQIAVQADLYQGGATVTIRDAATGRPLATLSYHVVHPAWEGVLAQKLTELLVMKSQRVQPVTGAEAQKAAAEAQKPS